MLVLRANALRLHRIAFVPNTNLLAAGGGGGNVYLWDLSTQKLRQSIQPFQFGTANLLSTTPDGRTLLVAGPGEVFRWEHAEQKATRLLSEVNWLCSISLNPAGDRLATRQMVVAGQPLRCYSFPEEHLLWEKPMTRSLYPAPVLFSPGGDEMIVADGKDIHFFRTDTGQVSRPGIRLPVSVTHLTLSPDGNTLVCSAQMRLIIWRLNPPGELATRINRPKHFRASAFHPSGRFLATASSDGKVRLWDAQTWQELPGFTWSIGPLKDIAFSPDGMLGACCSERGKIVVWDVD